MNRCVIAVSLVCALGMSAAAAAQTGAGSLRGYITDEQGAAMPGVTVTARSEVLIVPVSSVTDAAGYYRLINLPPGTYEVTAELTGFAPFKRQDILLRGGANFQVDMTMKLASLSESITVSGESPMLEVSNPSNVLNISGEFQREMPIQARRNWSDFLEITPGVHSRPFDDGSGRMVYFGHSTEHFAHVVQLEGAIASNYQDAQITYVAMGADMVSDTQVKTGGVDASAPMGVGLNINVITKSGGNTFKGSAAFAYQPTGWNGNNVNNCSASLSCKPATSSTVGTPTTAIVRQFDGGVGGPIRRDKIWFFGAVRRADLEAGISRTSVEVARLKAFVPNVELFNNNTKSTQPYGKVTAQAGRHQVAAFVQQDRLTATGDREYHYGRTNVYSTGGGLYGGKVTSVWGQRMTTTFLASYNNKGGADAKTFEGWSGTGPTITIHERASLTGGRLIGSGRLVSGGNFDNGAGGAGEASYSYLPSSQITLRADLTYFKDGLAGSHELQTGFFGAPRSTYDTTSIYLNDGFIQEERRQVDISDPSKGTVPFHRRFASPLEVTSRMARDRNLAVYFQDNWKPTPRLTANLGLRVDWVRRYDKIFDVVRENAHILQPRLGFSYLVTKNARNVLRGSYVRLGEQMMGRDAVTLFGGGTAAVGIIDSYDLDSNGSFETNIPTLARTGSLAASEFDPDLHQPYLDEAILGYRMQLPYSIGIDVAGIHRIYSDMYARIDINGFYPSGPNQPFGGFGKVDPNRGIVYQQTNNSWSKLNYTALELTATKNLSHGFQFMAGINRQWQHMSGDWNPTDPARFIQPSAFANDKLLYMPRGNNEDNSLPINTGTTVHTYGPTWQKYRLNFGGSWYAPYGIVVASSYTIEAGPWTGPVVNQLPEGDPQLAVFGPGIVVSSTGVRQSNPLSTRMRFAFASRGEGQVMAPAQKTLGLKVGKKIDIGRGQNVELAANIFNVLNAGDYTQYNYNGANEQFNPNYLGMRNQQPARALQVTMVYRF